MKIPLLLRIIIATAITYVVWLIASTFLGYFFYGHSLKNEMYKTYLHFFKNKDYINQIFCTSYVREKDILTNFTYETDTVLLKKYKKNQISFPEFNQNSKFYSLLIWEFKDLSVAVLKDIIINENSSDALNFQQSLQCIDIDAYKHRF